METTRFFVIGPLRTGSSLMARCLDDHPAMICLCESEINRALFRDHYLKLHFRRMAVHGLSAQDTINLLDRKKQDDVASLTSWYREIAPRLSVLYAKQNLFALGDKSPDFYRSSKLVRHLAEAHRLIYTVRDPRAILWSIRAQGNEPWQDKIARWSSLMRNCLTWKPFLDAPNVLVVRYEDLVKSPESTMTAVYDHLGLLYSPRFLRAFPRAFPQRFLWKTAVDYETGFAKEFDTSRVDRWRENVSAKDLSQLHSDERIREFMDRFGYSL
jgi:hypothetical protein